MANVYQPSDAFTRLRAAADDLAREGYRVVIDINRANEREHIERGPVSSPVVPRMPIPSLPPGSVKEYKPRCAKCGLDLSGPVGYVCPVANCPTFPQVTCGDAR